ncbi:uncharacterized protein LOC123701455 [Colias croceus]|uniref:uncharacterized protein LOC123701455 n=1 Tax=Colias crocea TaxID=72248 RepID=UPI001E27E165|nr:uncharacterized protein LOC123701455 [Colias croceus]
MDTEHNKAKALSKDETKALLSLIEGSAIITNKATNATNNKLKMEEWVRITTSFNASFGTCRRTPQQLRLKWENLKKNSRKRNTQIRMNRIKTGGGAPPYIPPDEILDRVASLLGSTVDGFTVEFGGDSEQVVDYGDGDCSDGAIINEVEKELPLDNGDGQEVPFLVVNTPAAVGPALPKRLFLGTPRASGSKKRPKPDEGCIRRNLAIAEYYEKKKMVLDCTYEKIKLENEKLKLEISKLKENKE